MIGDQTPSYSHNTKANLYMPIHEIYKITIMFVKICKINTLNIKRDI